MADAFHLDPKPHELSDVAGFRTGAASCGIKSTGLDVGVILCDADAGCGTAVFTSNAVAAAPVKLSRPRAAAGLLRAVVANAGNANCCTGEQGAADAEEMAHLASAGLGVEDARTLVASTGVIGRPFDMTKVRAGVDAACADALASGRGDLASAILTTDTARKTASASGSVGGESFRVAGVAKGAGMLAPRLIQPVGAPTTSPTGPPDVPPNAPPCATMLAFIVTDAAATPEFLAKLLPDVAARTFNRVTIDGDTSTNDTLCLLSSGAAGNEPVAEAGADEAKALAGAVEAVARELARAIARDGEGATKLVEVTVTGAASDVDAELAARTIAESPLVKTAIHGADPNWGRVLAAAGRSGARVDETCATVRLGGVIVFDRGRSVDPVPEAASSALAAAEVTVELDLGLGDASATVWTCDLTKEYVTINAEYHT